MQEVYLVTLAIDVTWTGHVPRFKVLARAEPAKSLKNIPSKLSKHHEVKAIELSKLGYIIK
jgi:hypothetical protein